MSMGKLEIFRTPSNGKFTKINLKFFNDAQNVEKKKEKHLSL